MQTNGSTSNESKGAFPGSTLPVFLLNQVNNLPSGKKRKIRQRPFRVRKYSETYEVEGGKTKTRHAWIVDGFATKPIMSNGELKSGRIREFFPTDDQANQRRIEIDSELTGQEIVPKQATYLSPDQLKTAEKAYNHSLPNGWDLVRAVLWIIELAALGLIGGLDRVMEALKRLPKEWDLVDLINWAIKVGYKQKKAEGPKIPEAWNQFEAEKERGSDSEKPRRPRTLAAIRETGNRVKVRFAAFEPCEMIEPAIYEYVNGSDPITTIRRGSPEKIVAFKGTRPFCFDTKVKELKNISSFLNFCAGKGWRTPISLKIPVNPKADEQRLPILFDEKHGNEKVKALLNVAYLCYDGRAAAFYSVGMFGGLRVAEMIRTGPDGLVDEGDLISVGAQQSKTHEDREVEITENLILMLAFLKEKGMYTAQNFQITKAERAVLQALAGFSCENEEILKLANEERARLASKGIILPEYCWGEPWPQNGLRRTAMSMHYQLFRNVARTIAWAGNSPLVFKKYYKRLCTKRGAAEYWVLLPDLMCNQGLSPRLPEGHKLEPRDGYLAAQILKAQEMAKLV